MERLIRDAHAVFFAAVGGVRADRLLAGFPLADVLRRPVEAYGRVFVVGAGKASIPMAGALEGGWGRGVDRGLVVVPHGYAATCPPGLPIPRRIEVVEAGHPVPDAAGVDASRRSGRLADQAGKDDLFVVLISGGGSALWPAPVGGIDLTDVQETVRLLLTSGADIHAVNAVRKHLGMLGGGQLAARAAPAEVVSLVISDVVGDDLSVIASGPTVPDRSTFAEAVDVLRGYDLWARVPDPVRRRLEKGVSGRVPETPKPGDPRLAGVRTVLLGTNRTALEAGREEAEDRGYVARILDEATTGEARLVGARLAGQTLQAGVEGPACLLWGGETTVTVTGSGTGGRNQEVALAAALRLDGAPRPIVFLSGGTDGIDGPTDAAGAFATPETAPRARRLGMDPAAFLDANDAYAFFDRLGGLLRPGPTHTNVMDVQVALIG